MAVLGKMRYGGYQKSEVFPVCPIGYALCPMPYALCPIDSRFHCFDASPPNLILLTETGCRQERQSYFRLMFSGKFAAASFFSFDFLNYKNRTR